jgi:hypothetical protein
MKGMRDGAETPQCGDALEIVIRWDADSFLRARALASPRTSLYNAWDGKEDDGQQ